MVKIMEVEEFVSKKMEVEKQHGAGPDDDCYEIDLEEFAKKVNLKEDDDVVVLSNPLVLSFSINFTIVKVEADQLEDSAKAYDDYGIEAKCSCIRRGSGGRGQHVAAAGDCKDNPYKIDEDKTSLLKFMVEDMFVIGKKPSGGCDKNERSYNTANAVVPGMLVVPVVKSEPVGDNAEEASYDHCLEMAPEKRIFDEDDDEDVVVV